MHSELTVVEESSLLHAKQLQASKHKRLENGDEPDRECRKAWGNFQTSVSSWGVLFCVQRRSRRWLITFGCPLCALIQVSGLISTKCGSRPRRLHLCWWALLLMRSWFRCPGSTMSCRRASIQTCTKFHSVRTWKISVVLNIPASGEIFCAMQLANVYTYSNNLSSHRRIQVWYLTRHLQVEEFSDYSPLQTKRELTLGYLFCMSYEIPIRRCWTFYSVFNEPCS